MTENRIVIKSRKDQVDMGFYETAVIKYNLRLGGMGNNNDDWWATQMGKYIFDIGDKWL